MPTPALFLDRDGVLNVDSGYVHDPAALKLYDDVSVLGDIAREGWLLLIASNQSGVGRGMFDREALEATNRALCDMLAARGVSIPLERFFVCVHAPSDGCHCRKPKPGLLEQAARRFNLDLRCSVLVGDKPSDVLAAQAVAGVGLLLERERPEQPSVLGSLRHLPARLEAVRRRWEDTELRPTRDSGRAGAQGESSS